MMLRSTSALLDEAASYLEDATHARRCAWCEEPMPRTKRRNARTCKKSCRQALSRFRVGAAGRDTSTPRRFAYADPPYPTLARRYYRRREVDHDKLVRELARDYPDGFALSTSAKALPEVLAIVVRYCGTWQRIRVCAWVTGSRPGPSWSARNAWEPLIVVGGRPTKLAVAEQLDDVYIAGRRRTRSAHPRALVGMKSPAFSEWMFRLLGAARGDSLVDVFPGSGAVTRAWNQYTRKCRARRRGQVRR